MEIKIFLLVTVCCLLVHGKSLDAPEIRQLLLKALSQREEDGAKRWWWQSDETDGDFETTTPFATTSTSDFTVSPLQEIFDELVETINGILGDGEAVQNAIDEVTSGLQELKFKMNELKRNSDVERAIARVVLDISKPDVYGDSFKYHYYAVVSQVNRDMHSLIKRSKETRKSSRDDMPDKPENRLNMLLQLIDNIKEMAEEKFNKELTSANRIKAIGLAVKNAQAEWIAKSVNSCTTTPSGQTESSTATGEDSTESYTATGDESTESPWSYMATGSYGYEATTFPSKKSVNEAEVREKLVKLLKKMLSRNE